MTNITAIPIPVALETFFETPKNGQSPKKRARTKLLINIEPTDISIRLIGFTIVSYLSFGY
jgi:hypothetical protein